MTKIRDGFEKIAMDFRGGASLYFLGLRHGGVSRVVEDVDDEDDLDVIKGVD